MVPDPRIDEDAGSGGDNFKAPVSVSNVSSDPMEGIALVSFLKSPWDSSSRTPFPGTRGLTISFQPLTLLSHVGRIRGPGHCLDPKCGGTKLGGEVNEGGDRPSSAICRP